MDVAEDESSNSDAENLELGLEDLEDVNFEYDEESGGKVNKTQVMTRLLSPWMRCMVSEV